MILEWLVEVSVVQDDVHEVFVLNVISSQDFLQLVSDLFCSFTVFDDVLRALCLPRQTAESAFFVFYLVSRVLLFFEIAVASSDCVDEPYCVSHPAVTFHVALGLLELSSLSQLSVELGCCRCISFKPLQLVSVISSPYVANDGVPGSLAAEMQQL